MDPGREKTPDPGHRTVTHTFHTPVIAVEVSLLEEDEVVLVHDFLAEDHGQELVVGDLLGDGGHNVSGLLWV